MKRHLGMTRISLSAGLEPKTHSPIQSGAQTARPHRRFPLGEINVVVQMTRQCCVSFTLHSTSLYFEMSFMALTSWFRTSHVNGSKAGV